MRNRVVVGDEDPAVLQWITKVLSEAGMEVVAEAKTGPDVIGLTHRYEPDVCLYSATMPQLNGIEVTAALAGELVESPTPVIVAASTFDDYVYGALQMGAKGFVMKDSEPEIITHAVIAALDDDELITAANITRLAGMMARPGAGEQYPEHPLDPLTEWDEQLLRLVAMGVNNNDLASRFFLTRHSVRTHISTLKAKLDARNRVELAIWAFETGRVHSCDVTA